MFPRRKCGVRPGGSRNGKQILAPLATIARRLLARTIGFGLVSIASASSPSVAQSGSHAYDQPAAEAPRRANINITPKRLTFDPGERTVTAYIFNQGTAPATFDITLVDRVMLPNGDIEPVSARERRPELAPFVSRLESAKDLLVATPRRATVAPGKGQTIRVRVKLPPRGAPEYRSHLTVTMIPPRDVGLTADEAAAAASGDQLSFQIASVFGISIPVIIRSGPADVQGRITGVRLAYVNSSEDQRSRRIPVLSFELERTGANSLYGNIDVRGSKSKVPYAIARGVGVYTEIGSRRIQIPLQRTPSSGERLEVKFIDDDLAPGRIIAQSSLVVG